MSDHPDDQFPERLQERIRGLAARIGPPATSVVDDVRRGQARLRRRRAATGAGSLAAVGVVVGVVALTVGSGTERAVDPASGPASGPSSGATLSADPSPTSQPSCLSDPAVKLAKKGASLPWRDPAVAPLLRSYRTIVANHLDPAGRHLQKRPDNVQSGGAIDGKRSCLSALGTKLGWSMPGQSGLGVIQVEVGNESWRDTQIQMAHTEWRRVRTELAGVTRAYVAQYPGGVAVGVVRSDGRVVGIDADALFGNNSTEPVSGVPGSVDDLLATAADPGFTLPR